MVAFVQYTAAGWWMLSSQHYFIADAMSRTLSAKFMVLSRDPHLGAVGFYWMPLPTVTRIPFVLLMSLFDREEFAGMMTSALFAALTIPVIVAIGRVLQQERAAMVVAAIYALSPITMYLGGNGMSESTLGFFIALTMLAFLKWRHTGTIQALAVLGLCLAGAVAARYEGLVLIPVVAVAVAISTDKLTRSQAAIVATLPAVVVFGCWTLASSLIMGDALFWWHTSAEVISRPVGAKWLPADSSYPRVFGHVAFILVALAPALVAVLAGCLSAFRRWQTSLGLLGFIFAVPIVVAYQIVNASSWGTMRFFSLAPLSACIGVLWVLRAGRDQVRTRVFGVVGVVLLAVGAITSGLLLSSTAWAQPEGEYLFFGPLLGREDVADNREFAVFTTDAEQYRQIAADLDVRLALGERAMMDSLQATVYLFSDHPKQIIVPEDRDFEPILSDPVGRFDYIVTLDGVAGSGNRTLIDTELMRNTEGLWVLVGDYWDVGKVYEWVPAGSAPHFVASSCCVPLRDAP